MLNANLPRAVIVDVDGTLALHKHRGPYDETRVLTDEPLLAGGFADVIEVQG